MTFNESLQVCMNKNVTDFRAGKFGGENIFKMFRSYQILWIKILLCYTAYYWIILSIYPSIVYRSNMSQENFVLITHFCPVGMFKLV
uniref:Uncharacterized protein n=1 Tax=Mus musculus TaxID=10090 RepID=Q3UFZ0_MOUSE|nr:unnamed protein product [Mus musculus]BAE28419.1 unnamed protein product [Mus musculus]